MDVILRLIYLPFNIFLAGMAELADALDLGSSGLSVQVQLLLPAPLTNLFELFELLDRYQSEMIDFFVYKENAIFDDN